MVLTYDIPTVAHVHGAAVDAKGLHDLSFKLATSHTQGHQILNDLIWRALSNAGIPSTKEPSGLSRNDGKRPDGFTLIPWPRGKPLAWDVTVVQTLADSYVGSTCALAGQNC